VLACILARPIHIIGTLMMAVGTSKIQSHRIKQILKSSLYIPSLSVLPKCTYCVIECRFWVRFFLYSFSRTEAFANLYRIKRTESSVAILKNAVHHDIFPYGNWIDSFSPQKNVCSHSIPCHSSSVHDAL
jgi:hypothetical protein